MNTILSKIMFVIACCMVSPYAFGSSVQDVGIYYPGQTKILTYPQSVWGNGNKVGGATSARPDLVEVYDWNSTGATLKILKGVAGTSVKVSITVDYTDASLNYKRESYVFSITIKTNPIKMIESSISMQAGDTHQLSYKGTVAGKPVPEAKWTTSNSSVATVNFLGLVTAKKEGTTTITATSTDGEETQCEVSVSGSLGGGGGSDPEPTIIAEFVDLGLSVKWTTCNLGASTPTGFGSQYAWGATEPDTESSPTEMWTTIERLEANGVIEDGHFTPEYDACTQELGEGYRVPTISEWQELMDNCRWESVKISGEYCIKGISKKNGESIIFPRTITMMPGTNLETKAFGLWSCTSSSHPVYPQAYYVWSNDLSVDDPELGSMDAPSCILHDSVNHSYPLRAVYDPSAGVIDYIETKDMPVEYYNLQGLPLQNPHIGQIVIKKQGASVKKMIYI